MVASVQFPSYAYEALKNMNEGNKEKVCFAVLSYLFEGVQPELAGWEGALFALIAADIENREELIARGGEKVAELLGR